VSQVAALRVRSQGYLIRLLTIFAALLILVVLLAFGALVAGWQIWASYHYRAAGQAIERRDFEEAHAHLALCLEIWPRSGETHFETARAARRAGRYADAERHLKICKELKWVPQATDLEYVLLQIQRGNLKTNEVIAVDWVKRDHPDSVLILEALAQGYLKNYDLIKAIQCLNLWLEKEPDTVQALIWRGDAFERMRRMDEAIEDYRRAAQIDPESDDARRLLGTFLVSSHHAADAAPHFEWLYERRPDDPAILLGLARCKHEMGQVEEALRLLDLLLGADPRNPQALAERGKLALQQGDRAEAEALLRKAADLAPYEQEIVFSFLLCLEQLGEVEEAKIWRARLDHIEADLDRMKDVMHQLRLAPQDPMLRLEAGKLLIQNGQDQEGLRWLDSALQQDPAHGATRDFLAQYFEKRGDLRRAKYYRRTANAEGITNPIDEALPLLPREMR
jgi:Tfp pilus assembly protein PilF